MSYNFELLSESEKDHICGLNRRNDYCLTPNILKALSVKHKNARVVKDEHTMALVEYRLTDINFHTECSMMVAGDYAAIDAVIRNW
ncbi:hypothetical protein RFF05_07940 [Bengtsoniella intestinalis]|uniref:hypothetical protein n=1 Tax=Bengtsoniella intestinalis TaxID=3073143 RepID=UPI00391F57C6